jgi:glycosyltransferase involved in cell wall biosynthesis
MRCPSLNNLPPPLDGKTGWPWTKESVQLPSKMPDGSTWPKISIVTPSLNQSQFIEETIRSVLLQGYPNLEYIIMDGGSTDGSVDIIKKYEPWLSYWISESDKGQANAINKGIYMIKGEIFAWINSDDIYLPNTFKKVSLRMRSSESKNENILIGNVYAINDKGKIVGELLAKVKWRIDVISYWKSNTIYQPSVFVSSLLIKNFPLDESLVCAFDKDLWIRLMENNKIYYYKDFLSCFRNHRETKSSTLGLVFESERRNLTRKYWKNRIDWQVYFAISYILTQLIHFYHMILRKRTLKILLKTIGEQKYNALRNFKKRYLGFLSKVSR